MANLANLVINQTYPWVQNSDTDTEAALLAANIPENITVPTDSATSLKAGYVIFGSPVAADFYARAFNSAQGADRVTNGTFAEYVTNGTFASDTGWAKGAGWAIGAGVATATTASSDLSQATAIALIAGYTYTITYTVTRSAGSVTPVLGGAIGTPRSSSATFTETIVAGATQILAFTGTGFTGTVDNVTVTAWTLGMGWTTDGSTAIATGAISTAISQTINPATPLVIGQPYLVTYTVTRSAGSITPTVGSSTGTARSTSATFSEVITPTSGQVLSFGTSGFTGTLDNVIIQPVVTVPTDSTTGLLGAQNPKGYALPSDVLYVSMVSAGTPIITTSFYKR